MMVDVGGGVLLPEEILPAEGAAAPAKLDCQLIQFGPLVEAAEACRGQDDLALVEYHGAWYLRNPAGIVLDVHRNRSFPHFLAENENYARLVEAARPAVILAMAATVESLESQVRTLQGESNSWQSGYDEGRRMGDKTARDERDQMQAELVALREEVELLREATEPVAVTTEMKRRRWMENIQQAIYSPIRKELRRHLATTLKEIENSLRYGGTRRLRDQLEAAKTENKRVTKDNSAVRASCVEMGTELMQIRGEKGRLMRALHWFCHNATVKEGAAPEWVTAACIRALKYVAEGERGGQ